MREYTDLTADAGGIRMPAALECVEESMCMLSKWQQLKEAFEPDDLLAEQGQGGMYAATH